MKNNFAPPFVPPVSNAGPASSAAPEQKRAIMSWFLIFSIHLYRALLSPFLGGNCKFYPSCSHYAEQAIAIHGARRGTWLALKRLLRCRPFTKGGVEPVPAREEFDFQAPLHGQESSR
jgi:uncharacterized protein